MTRNVWILIFLFFIPVSAPAQNLNEPVTFKSYDVIGIAVGMNQIMEENLLARLHSGFALELSYDHRSIGDDYRGARAAIGYSTVSAEPEGPTKSLNVSINACSNYGFSLIRSDQFNCFVGPALKLAYSFGGYPNWDDSHAYWANNFSLGVENTASYELGENTRFFSTLSFPVLSVSSRPDAERLYKMDDATFGGVMKALHSNINVGFWNKVFGIHFNLEYQFPMFHTKTEAISYSLDYTRMSNSNALPYAHVLHQLGLRILL
jgi:hypothetical protein